MVTMFEARRLAMEEEFYGMLGNALRKTYVDWGMSKTDMIDKFVTTKSTLEGLLKYYGIPERTQAENATMVNHAYRNMPRKKRVKKHVPVKTPQKKAPSTEILRKEYHDEEMSLREMEAKHGVSYETIRTRLRDGGIRRRERKKAFYAAMKKRGYYV